MIKMKNCIKYQKGLTVSYMEMILLYDLILIKEGFLLEFYSNNLTNSDYLCF